MSDPPATGLASTKKDDRMLNPGAKPGAGSSHESTQVDSGVVGNQATVAPATDTKDKLITRETLLASSKGTNSIIVSPKQRGNPILKFVRNVPWEFGDIIPDYQLGQTRCALYLSLKYHNLNPQYIHERLKQLGHSYDLRVMLVQIDTLNPHHALKEIANICILADCTLILAFSTEEAGRYLETYKSFENKPPDLVMERTEKNYLSRMTECLTNVKKINKTDAATLLSTFHSFEKIVEASQEDLSLCPGFGPQKAKRLHDIFHEPFLKAKRPKGKPSPAKNTSPAKSPIKDFFKKKPSSGTGSPVKKTS